MGPIQTTSEDSFWKPVHPAVEALTVGLAGRGAEFVTAGRLLALLTCQAVVRLGKCGTIRFPQPSSGDDCEYLLPCIAPAEATIRERFDWLASIQKQTVTVSAV